MANGSSLENMYNYISDPSRSWYTNSFEDFKSKYSTLEEQSKLFDFLKEKNTYTNSKGDFLNKYFPIAEETTEEIETTSVDDVETEENVETIEEIETEDVVEKKDKSIDFGEMDKRNDMVLRPDRYDISGNLKPEFEVYVDSKGIAHSKMKEREATDVSIGEDIDYEFRIDKTKDKVRQVVDMYNTVNENDKEVQDLLKNMPNANMLDIVEEVQKQRYKNITSDMNQQEIDDMRVMLEKKEGLNITTTGTFALPEVVVEEEFITTEATKIDIKREKEIKALLANVDFDNKEVREIIAEEYFDFSGISLRNTGRTEDIIHDNRLLAKTIPQEKQQQFRRWQETGELPMYSSVDGFGISMDMIDNAVALVKDKTVQTYFEPLSNKERFDVMKHMPTAIPGTTAFVDYYKQRRKDEKDFKEKYGYTLTHKRKGNDMDPRVYVPVNDYGADWAKHFSKAVNQSSNDYIKSASDRIIKDDKNLTVEIEKFNALNNDLMARSEKLNRELEDMGGVTSDSPADVIDNYNAIIGELRALKQNIADRGLNDIYTDISRRSEKLKADIDGLTEVAEVNQDLSIITYASGLNYSNIDRTLGSIEKGLVNPVSVAGSDLIDFVSGDTWDLGGKARQHSIKTDEDFEETFSRNLSFSWQNLDIWLPQALANNSASIAAVGSFFVNPALGYSLFFGMGYGHKVTDIERGRQVADKQIEAIDFKLKKATTEDERLALVKQKDDWQRKKDITFWQERISGITAGGSEIIWERLGSVNAIKNFSKWSRVVGKGTFKRTMGIGYGIGLTQVIELGEELGTEFTNNISDIVNLKENKSIGDGINKDFFANVIVTGLALQSKNTGQTTWNLLSDQVRTRDQKKINRERLQKIVEIDKRLQNPLALNSVEVEALEKEKMDLIEEAGIETVMNIDKLNDLTFEEKQEVFERARQAQETLTELEALGATGDLTSNYTKKNKKFLMDKYNELVSEKDQLLDKGGREIREKAKNSNNSAAAAYNAGLNKFVTNLSRYNTTKNGKQFTQIKDISDLKQNEEIFDDYQEILEAYENGDYAFHAENGDVYVFQENIDNQIYGTVSTNKITGEKTYSDNNTLEAMIAAVAPFHENLHNRNRTVGIIKDGKVVESAVEAIEGIEAEMQSLLDANRITQEVFDLFKARKDIYTDNNTGQVNMEELINLVGDLHFIGALPISSFNNLFGLKSLLNNASSYFFDESAPMVRFKTKDVFGYVQSFHKQSKARKVKLASRTTDDKKAISLSKSTYDQFNPEELVQIIKAPSSTAIQKAAANESLAKQFDLLAIKALNYDTRKGDIAREEVLAAAREYLPGIINRFDPETAKFSTFVTGNIGPKQAVIYEEAKGISFETVSLDAPQAQQIAQETTEVENTLVEDKVTKVNVLQVGKVASKQKEIRKVTKVKKGDTHKQITDNNKGEVGSVIFDIPANKIANPQDNITTSDKIINPETGKPVKKGETGIPERSEATNIQDHFTDINTTKSFIKILNPTNVSEKDADINKIGENIQVSRGVYGRAIGLPNRILEYFYDPVFKPDGKRLRSQGLASQVGVWKLKSKFKNLNDKQLTKVAEQFQRDLGITEKQKVNKLPTKQDRSTIGQLLKGAAVVTSMQVSLSAAQRRLAAFPTLARRGAKKAKAQEIADVTAGQSKLAFSKATISSVGSLFAESQTDPNFNLDLAGQNKLNTLLVNKKLKETLDLKKEIRTVNGRKKILDNFKWIMANLGPREMWFGKQGKNKFTTSGADYNVSMSKYSKVDAKKGRIPKGKKVGDYKDLKGRQALLKLREDINSIGKKDSGFEFGKPIKDKKGKTLTDYSVSSYSTLLGDPKQTKFKKKEIAEFNEKVSLIHKAMWSRINDLVIDDKKNAPIIGTYLKLVANHTGHWHKMGAQIAGWSVKPKGVTNSKGVTTLYEYEHAMPATAAYLYLMHTILDPKADFGIAYKAVMDNYKLIALDKAENAKLGKANLGRSMPKGWRLDKNFWWQRYFNQSVEQFDGGIDPNSIVGLDGKTFGEMFNIKKPITKANLNKTKKLNKAIMFSRSTNESKGITVLDFDDTLATTKSLVKFTKPDGTTGTLNAEEFASTYEDLLSQDYVFDFSEFNKVVKGKIAPLFQKALKLQGKFGPENMFVLTARPPAAAKAIFDFLKANGLNIPIKNITGLANSTAEAKALWMAEKVADGYNDFYFADDALQNVQAVDNMLEQFDVKRKVQQAKIKFSKSTNTVFNDILENVTGIESKKRFSAIKARKRGASKGKFRFFIPPSHEDFVGLLYNFIGVGKKGNAHRDFFEKALIRPLNRAYRELNTAKQSIANDYKSLNKQFEDVKKKLTKKTPDGDFTYQDAIRVYLWNKHGYTVPGLSPTDQTKLTELVMSDPSLQAYAETLNVISKQETYVKPSENWEIGDLRTDLDDATGRVGREQYFAEFQENADIIFSEENLNKIEAAYGEDMVSALKDILYRTKTGRNRPSGQNALTNRFLNYLNGSVASTMFVNVRSALLQQMSIVNFINYGDNNVLMAAKAFANIPQYFADWAMLFNSDFMKQRRGGIKTDVNGAELAASLRGAKNTPRALLGKLLELGFLPTQIGDNFAIATGGAPFYRNRVNTYLKQGLNKKEAESKAFIDFQKLAEETQQSARPDMVSQQQASPLGKVILAFQNVTSQFNRIGKKAFLDIKNRRITPGNPTQLQSDMSNASRIAYYFAVQNVIFYSLQTALFAMMFDDDPDEEKLLKKQERVINGSIDSVLRGVGVMGAVIATLKNMAIKFAEQREKGYNADESAVLMEMLNVSPPLGIKARKLVNAEKTLNYNRDVIKEMELFDIDNPIWSATTNLIESTTNAPLNRAYNKTVNTRNALDNQYTAFQRAMFISGYTTWSLDLGDTEKMTEIKATVKEKKKEASKVKREEKKKVDLKEKELAGEEKQKQEKKEGKQVTCLVCKLPIEKGKKYCTVHEKKEQRKDGKKVQCRKIKSNGKRCGMQTNNKSGYCYYHD